MPVFATNLITAALTVIARLRERPPKGQGLVEYTLILFFLSIMVIVALQFLQPAISNTLNTVTNSI
jgi:Flp pilus assembly pilin Flp